MGTKEEVFLRGAATLGIPVNKTRDVSAAGFRPQENGILQIGNGLVELSLLH